MESTFIGRVDIYNNHRLVKQIASDMDIQKTATSIAADIITTPCYSTDVQKLPENGKTLLFTGNNKLSSPISVIRITLKDCLPGRNKQASGYMHALHDTNIYGQAGLGYLPPGLFRQPPAA